MSNTYFVDNFSSSAGYPSSWPELFPELLEFKNEEGNAPFSYGANHNSSPLLSDESTDLATSALSSPTRASDQSLCSPSRNMLGADFDPFEAADTPSPVSGYAPWLPTASVCASSPDTDPFFDFDTEPISSEPEPECTILSNHNSNSNSNSNSDNEEAFVATQDSFRSVGADASSLNSHAYDGVDHYNATIVPSTMSSSLGRPSWPESFELRMDNPSPVMHSHLPSSSPSASMASSSPHKEQHRATRVCGGCGLEKKRVYRYLGASAPFCNACNQHWRRHLHECPLCLKLRSLNATEQLRGIDITNYDGPTKARRKDPITHSHAHSLMQTHPQGTHTLSLSLSHSNSLPHVHSHSHSHSHAPSIGHHTLTPMQPIPNASSFPISPASGPIRKRPTHFSASTAAHKPYAVASLAFHASA